MRYERDGPFSPPSPGHQTSRRPILSFPRRPLFPPPARRRPGQRHCLVARRPVPLPLPPLPSQLSPNTSHKSPPCSSRPRQRHRSYCVRPSPFSCPSSSSTPTITPPFPGWPCVLWAATFSPPTQNRSSRVSSARTYSITHPPPPLPPEPSKSVSSTGLYLHATGTGHIHLPSRPGHRVRTPRPPIHMLSVPPQTPRSGLPLTLSSLPTPSTPPHSSPRCFAHFTPSALSLSPQARRALRPCTCASNAGTPPSSIAP